jgi:hypothetical protein
MHFLTPPWNFKSVNIDQDYFFLVTLKVVTILRALKINESLFSHALMPPNLMMVFGMYVSAFIVGGTHISLVIQGISLPECEWSPWPLG